MSRDESEFPEFDNAHQESECNAEFNGAPDLDTGAAATQKHDAIASSEVSRDVSQHGTALHDEREAQARVALRDFYEQAASPAIPRMRFEGRRLVPDYPDVKIGHALIMKALGITDLDVYEMILDQIGDLCCVSGNSSEYGPRANAMLFCIKALKPKDHMDLLLVMSIAASQMLSIKAGLDFAFFHGPDPNRDNAARHYRQFNKVMTEAMEMRNRLRSTGEQIITVQHINVQKNAQAIIGDVTQNAIQAGNPTAGLAAGSENKMQTSLEVTRAPGRTTVTRRFKASGR